MSLNGNERAAIIGQLVALRNVLDGVLTSLEDAEKPACEHPEEQRKYSGTMGTMTFTCTACGEKVTEPAPSQGA